MPGWLFFAVTPEGLPGGVLSTLVTARSVLPLEVLPDLS